MARFDGRFALITGGSGGIGRATVLEFAREGARGIGLHFGSNRGVAEALAKEIERSGVKAVPIQADISRRDDARRLVDTFLSAFRRIDALVCCAGHPFRRDEWFAEFEELSEEAFLRPLRIDLLGSLYVAQAAAGAMKKQRAGTIVFIGSTPAITGDTVGFSYFVAKAGVIAATKGLAQLLGPYNVHVNAIAPGAVDTEAMSALSEAERQELVREAALKRTGSPAEIARKAVFLCSDDASFMTGQTLIVDGGYAMR